MLPPFTIPVTLEGADPVEFLAVDVPAYVFFAGMPDSVPGAACFAKEGPEGQRRVMAGWDGWMRRLLTDVIVAPRLTPELVQRLGEDVATIVDVYLRAVGWLEPKDDALAPGLLGAAVDIERSPSPAVLRQLVAVPPPNQRGIIRALAAKARLSPWAVQSMPISEWIWTYRVLLQDELTKKQGPAPAELPPNLAHIGWEGS